MATYDERMATTTDVGEAGGWRITDEVTQLRECGSEQSYSLPAGSTSTWILGSSETCSIQLNDKEGRISRQHARLVRDDRGWYIHDCNSKNGIWIDGARQSCYLLAPGTEIGLGGFQLIAESKEIIALRRLLQRLLGWAPEQAIHVDRALRSIRDAATLRAPLLLSGEGDLAPIARRLHTMALGEDRPFVVFDGREIRPAMAAAAHGTLYVASMQTLANLPEVLAAVRVPGSRVRLTMCGPNVVETLTLIKMLGRVTWNELPPLAKRGRELRRIIDEYLHEAASKRGVPVTNATNDDIAKLRKHGFDGLADVEEAVDRLLVFRTYGVTEGAAVLGFTQGALSKWALRRSLPPQLK